MDKENVRYKMRKHLQFHHHMISFMAHQKINDEKELEDDPKAAGLVKNITKIDL